MGDDFRRKAAFTLAEVLITLGVIGIVAAMTMPVLTANYQKTVLKNQFKKAYSTYQQALLKTSFDNGGDISCYYNADNSGDKVLTNCPSFYEAFTKELKVTKICENNTECNTNYSGITYTGGCSTSLSLQSKQYVLADGTIIFPYTDGINYPLFFVDINGLKGPNKPGYDLFSFMIMRKEIVMLISLAVQSQDVFMILLTKMDLKALQIYINKIWNLPKNLSTIF